MKKLFAAALILCMFMPFTVAENIEDTIFSYNIWTGWTGAEELPERDYAFSGDSYEWCDEYSDKITFKI